MEKTEGRPIQALLCGWNEVVDVTEGDTVFFGRRKFITPEEGEERLRAILAMDPHEAAGRSR